MLENHDSAEYGTLIACLEELRDHPPVDNSFRKTCYARLREAMLSVEEPIDTIRRLCFAPLQLSIVNIAIDLGLFGILEGKDSTFTVEELAGQTGTQTLLASRILRYLASHGMVSEHQQGVFAASNMTRTLNHLDFQAGLKHHFDVQLPCWNVLPQFLQSTAYQNPGSADKTAFQTAHKTDLTAFVWAAQRPRIFQDFSQWMKADQGECSSWLDVLPLQMFLQEASTSKPIFVDVGGGLGNQCLDLKQRLPQITRPMVVEDLAAVISQAPHVDGVDYRVHNFWDTQPIKGASFYYLRRILHDYPDAKCIELLRLQAAAMSSGSTILVDEIVLPDVGVHWQAAEMDLALMSILASMERTKGQWSQLVKEAGLSIQEIYTYSSVLESSVMILKHKSKSEDAEEKHRSS